ncbi:hypothetical protein SKAU_G00234950 [Synaphobranchus kaupii]|uniref:Uncharacterized protein n=1 Tax=Synaphobranchus kaupii TaxID=118154 RepID=A0A9Q1F6U4_SYNKA|nr:hypothetical protein SKAU_G00234950 [Synaphobranchus kaupii]
MKPGCGHQEFAQFSPREHGHPNDDAAELLWFIVKTCQWAGLRIVPKFWPRSPSAGLEPGVRCDRKRRVGRKPQELRRELGFGPVSLSEAR